MHLLQSQFDQCVNSVMKPSTTETITLLNPPYGNIKIDHALLDRYEMAYRWQKRDDNTWRRTSRATQIEQSVLFIEHVLQQCQNNEIIVALVPDGILSNPGHQSFRQWLIHSAARIVASISLPTTIWQLECKLGMKTSILALQKHRSPDKDDYSIFMAVVEMIGWTSRGQRVYKTDANGNQTIDSDLTKVITEFISFTRSSTAVVETVDESADVGEACLPTAS